MCLLDGKTPQRKHSHCILHDYIQKYIYQIRLVLIHTRSIAACCNVWCMYVWVKYVWYHINFKKRVRGIFLFFSLFFFSLLFRRLKLVSFYKKCIFRKSVRDNGSLDALEIKRNINVINTSGCINIVFIRDTPRVRGHTFRHGETNTNFKLFKKKSRVSFWLNLRLSCVHDFGIVKSYADQNNKLSPAKLSF